MWSELEFNLCSRYNFELTEIIMELGDKSGMGVEVWVVGTYTRDESM